MTQTIYPALRYRDAQAAIEWLTDVLGFEQGQVHAGDDGTIHHAELRFETGWVMLGSATDATDDRLAGEFGPSLIYLATDHVDELHERARARGAQIAMELTDTDYGSRDFAVRDPEGNVWSFGTYRVGEGG